MKHAAETHVPAVSAGNGERIVDMKSRRDHLIRQGIAHIADGKFDLADADLAAALELDPTSAAAAFQYALSAVRRRNWQEVRRRWEAAALNQPSNVDVPIGLCHAMRELGEIDQAQSIIKDALVAFSCDPKLLPSLAHVATAKRDYARSVACWTRYLEHTPDDFGALQCLGDVWLKSAHYTEAEKTLARAAALQPNDAWAAVLLARARTLLGQWDSVYEQWHEIMTRHGNNATVREHFRELMQLLRLSMADAESDPQAVSGVRLWAVPSRDEFQRWESVLEQGWQQSSHRGLMMQFESLGAGCEFGLVQRHFGAEPLGLLRWAAIPLPALLDALASRFADAGSPDSTQIEVYETGEYAVVDRRYRMRSHTRIFVGQAEPEKLLLQQRTRLRYLRDKFLEDLSVADKILVYGLRSRMTDREIGDLYSAVSQFGPNYLLCVRPEEKGRSNGTVERIAERLFVGYVDNLWHGTNTPLSYDAWLQICQRSVDLRAAIEVVGSFRVAEAVQ